MNKSFFTIIYLIIMGNSLFAQFNWINPYPQANKLNDVQIVESDFVVACGKNGIFLQSDNLGINWVVKQVTSNIELFAVDFANIQYGVVVGENGNLFRTSNGGKNWDALPFPLNDDVIDVQLLSNNEIFVLTTTKILHSNDLGENWNVLQHVNYLSNFEIIGDSTIWSCGNNIYKSTNLGNTWEIVDSTYYRYHSLSVIDENHIDFLFNDGNGQGNGLLRTTDGGENFSVIGFPINFLSFSNIHSLDKNTIICIGLDNYITYDGGTNWKNLELKFLENDYDPWLSAVDFNEAGIGFIVGASYNRQVILKTSDFGQNWESPRDFTNADFKSTCFLDSLNCFVVGSVKDTGKIWRSHDGGNNWSEVYSTNQRGLYINQIGFVNNNFGYAAGNHIYITNDKGENWVSLTNNYITIKKSIFFIDSLKGWVVGEEVISGPGGSEIKHVLSKTTDGGNNWTYIYMSTSMNSIEFYDSLNGFIACGNGDIIVSHDGGNSWELLYDSNINSLNNLFILDKDNIYISGSEGRILYTNDGGSNWNDVWLETMASVNSIKFINELVGIATSTTLHSTKDGGKTWREINVNYENFYFDVDFTKRKALVVGNNGCIIEIPISTITNIEENFIANNVKNDFYLFQNYPNPFNPTTQISYQIPKDGFVNLVVYNVLGQKIAVLVNKHQTSGKYSVQFDASNLSSGVYIYKLQAGEFSSARKMLLTK